MARIRGRTEDIRRYVLEQVANHPDDIARCAAEHFGITRQAIMRHLKQLTCEGALCESGRTRGRSYKLKAESEWRKTYALADGKPEDVVWNEDIRSALGTMPEGVSHIWHYGFTELFNNVLDHSEGTEVWVSLRKTAVHTSMLISDNKVGIFQKIKKQFELPDARHAVLELHKAKLTTDPARHTGGGIFFTSRMFDSFAILSGGVYFSHAYGEDEDWILDARDTVEGTCISMILSQHSARTTKQIFNQFASGDDLDFNKTVVPLRLAQYGHDRLVSRSQGKCVTARLDLFKTVIFDFTGIEEIGPAFADEVFRVFANRHPTLTVLHVNANAFVKGMIERVRGGAAASPG